MSRRSTFRSSLTHPLRRFVRNEDGALVLVEFLTMLPLLIGAFFALFLYWDAFRAINQAQKATYAISDAISREGDVTPAYLDGMENVLRLLAPNAPSYRMRITSIQWDAVNNRYQVLFSRSPGNKMAPLNAADVMARSNAIPTMSHGGSVVIVESLINYDPPVHYGLEPDQIENFIVTRPRAARRSCLTTSPSTCPATL